MKAWLTQLFCMLVTCLSGQGKLAITNYENLYPLLDSYTVWGSARNSQGILYFGGSGCVLEYDGVRWESYEMPNKSDARAIVCDTNDLLYIGGINELGYLDTRTENKKYISLTSKLPPEHRYFDDVWNIYRMDGKIIYHTLTSLLEWDGSEFRIFPVLPSYHRPSLLDRKLWFIQKGKGLCSFSEDSVREIKNSIFFKDMILEGLLPFSPGKLLLGTRNEGVFLCSYTDSTLTDIKTFNSSLNRTLNGQQLYGIQAISNNRFIFLTLKNGIYITDSKGNIQLHIHTKNGLNSNTIYSANSFPDGTLWITGSRGISKMLQDSPLIQWDGNFGLDGVILSIVRFNGVLKAGTLSGLYDYHPESEDPRLTFRKPTDLFTAVWTMYSLEKEGKKELLLGTSEGLFHYDGYRYTQVKDCDDVFVILPSEKFPSIYYIGTETEAFVMSYEKGKFQFKGNIPHIQGAVQAIEESEEGDLWISLKFRELYQIPIRNESQLSALCQETDFIDRRFDALEAGLPDSMNVKIYKHHQTIVASTSQGIFFYNPQTRKFEKNNSMGKNIRDFHQTVNYFSTDSQGNIWTGGNQLFLKKPDNTYDIFYLPLPQIATISTSYVFYHEAGPVTWIGGNNGLFYFNGKYLRTNPHNVFQTIVRSVFSYDIHRKKQIYDVEKEIHIAPTERSVRFEYSAPYFLDETGISYSYYLEGYDEQWSHWERNPFKEYNNLSPGKYTFKVKAKNIAAEESAPAIITFSVGTPWYKTHFFILSLILLTLGSIRLKLWNDARIWKARNKRLEEKVKERTLALERQNEEIRKQAEELTQKNKLLEIQQSEILKQQDSLEQMSKKIASIENRFLIQATRCIEKNIQNIHFSIDDLCREMKVSHPTLYRKIKNATDLSVSGFINEVRLKEAARLLKEESLSIAEVSYLSGFSDPAYFTRCFKKRYGVSPSNYPSSEPQE